MIEKTFFICTFIIISNTNVQPLILHLSIYLLVCLWREKTVCRSQFSPSSVWVWVQMLRLVVAASPHPELSGHGGRLSVCLLGFQWGNCLTLLRSSAVVSLCSFLSSFFSRKWKNSSLATTHPSNFQLLIGLHWEARGRKMFFDIQPNSYP